MFDWINDCMASLTVFGRVVTPKKYGLGGVGLGNGRFDSRMEDRNRWCLGGLPNPRNMILEGLGQEIVDLMKD